MIQKLSQEIIHARSLLPDRNDFDIKNLLAFPRFFDWVDCEVDRSTRFQMFLAGGDDGVALRFFWNGGFEPTSMRLWSRAARGARAVVDIGAHTGCYSLAAAAAGSQAEVWSFEPHSLNFARLCMNLRANGVNASRAVPMACGERVAAVPFSVIHGSDFLTSGGRIGRNPQLLIREVQMTALDRFFPSASRSSPIDLIKIDTEGYEPQCLEGMLGILQRDSPTIFFESVDVEASRKSQSLLLGLGYKIFLIDDESGQVDQVDVVEPMRLPSGQVPRKWHNRAAVHRSRVNQWTDIIRDLHGGSS